LIVALPIAKTHQARLYKKVGVSRADRPVAEAVCLLE
jgi:hypothetical protein